MKTILILIALTFSCNIHERAMGEDCHKTTYEHRILTMKVATQQVHEHEQCELRKMMAVYPDLIEHIPMTDYCEGFVDGYERGWCYAQRSYTCVPPVTPVCPVPDVVRGDSYKAGFDDGFSMGLNDYITMPR